MEFLLLALTLFGQTNPCDTNVAGPFMVTSARSFTVQWCTQNTRTAPDGTTVPERIDGFYFTVDNTRQDIGMATSLGLSSVTNRNAWQYVVSSGISRGAHTVTITPWNYQVDNNGQPTTTRLEGASTSVPFTAVDPVFNLPPLAPSGGRIIR